MAHMYAVFIDKYVHIGQAKCARRRQIAPFISPTTSDPVPVLALGHFGSGFLG